MSDGGGATLRLARHAPIALVLALLSPWRRHRGRRRPGRPQRRPGRQGQGPPGQARRPARRGRAAGRAAERHRRPPPPPPAAPGPPQARQQAAQRELDTAQAQLDEQVRATYMERPPVAARELVGGANPPDVHARIPMEKAALEARAAVVTEVRDPQGRGRQPQRQVATDLAEADLVHRRQADERRQVQRLVSQLQATLDRIDSSSAGYLEAERGRSEARGGPPGPATCPGSGRCSPGSRPGRWPGRPSAGPWPSSATPTGGGDRARQLRLLGADQLGLPGRRGRHPAGVAGPVGRRPARRGGRPASRRPGLLRRQPRRPGRPSTTSACTSATA
jgi:hypothetical protein